MAGTCPVCEAALVEIRSKSVCPFCHLIVETCCDGGECRPPVKSAEQQQWFDFIDSHRQTRLDYEARRNEMSADAIRPEHEPHD